MEITVGSKVAQVLSISFAMGKRIRHRCLSQYLRIVGSWEMLGSLVNGGTLYLRGSDWNATLEQVSTQWSFSNNIAFLTSDIG
jgi:hypothetical protein